VLPAVLMDFLITLMVLAKFAILLVVIAQEMAILLVLLVLIRLICMTGSAVQLALLNTIRIFKQTNVMDVTQHVMNVMDQQPKNVNLVEMVII
jgi:hypothetical protein